MILSIFKSRFLFPNLDDEIPEYSAMLRLFKNHFISIGKSPSGALHVTDISCPELAGPSSKAKGMILGGTDKGVWLVYE